MKTLSHLLKSATAERKPAAATERPARRLSDAELDHVAGGGGSKPSGSTGDESA